MKWYQVFECDNTVENPLVCDTDNLVEYNFEDWDFMEGKKITNWNNNIFIKAEKEEDDGDPDDALQSHLMIPIFSKRLVDELNINKIEGIQYLPIKAIRPNNKSIGNFYIVNFLNYISALNYERSNYTRFRDDFPNLNVRGKIAGVKKFVLYKKKLEGMDVIRLEDYQQRFFVSEKFKNIFEKNKFTGYSFEEIELS